MPSNSTEVASAAPREPLFESCLSCRILSGLALIGSGIWVFLGPRRAMQQKTPPNMWNITQMTFALGLVSWGCVMIANPVGKQKRKGE